METTTAPQKPGDPPPGLPPEAPDALRTAAESADAAKKLDGAAEHSAVKFLLGQQRAPRYTVPVQFDTDEGMQELRWTIKALDGKTIDQIERRNTDESKGPIGEMDDLRMNAEMVVEATVKIADKTGAETDVRSGEFLAGLADPVDAMLARFHFQSGLLAGLASSVRRISGWAPDRVGEATRVMVEATGNSSSDKASSG